MEFWDHFQPELKLLLCLVRLILRLPKLREHFGNLNYLRKTARWMAIIAYVEFKLFIVTSKSERLHLIKSSLKYLIKIC